ncbi:MAG: EamA family transporter [Thermodesulfobacterium geofontis]|uniref:EamA family transporter n=1 Tax=Thermodesulfobacterium geofontis TaxID=1295609 RepID=A0A2N7QFZ0_9BACT|nr:MAG: EamA family transporter [Thermodesulfobacterium geofontis]PMP97838.1 MAG: EamA family transporter [Thermodesulfobacterium geofontis]
MVWCIFAILSGFFVALSDALNKKYLSSLGHSYMVVARTLGSFPFLFPIFLLLTYQYKGLNFFSFHFIINISVLLILEIIATILYMKGIKLSPLSLTIPFLSFTPVFIILTGYLLLGEKISIEGFLGIVLVVIGSYCINLPSIKMGILAPIKSIKKERGSFLLLQVAFIYSITSVLGKKGIILSNPLWFASFYFSILGIASTFVIKILYRIKLWDFIKNHYNSILLVGLIQALMCYFHMIALSQIETAYMIALKRTSILFAVILGYFIFKETHILVRLFAVVLMLAGIFTITFLR